MPPPPPRTTIRCAVSCLIESNTPVRLHLPHSPHCKLFNNHADQWAAFELLWHVEICMSASSGPLLPAGIHSACTWNLRTRRAHQYKGSRASLRDSAMYCCTHFSDILCGTQPSRCAGHVGNFRCGDMCNWGTLRGDISHHIFMHHAHASTAFVVKICS